MAFARLASGLLDALQQFCGANHLGATPLASPSSLGIPMDKKQGKQHQNLSLHERYLALLDKHSAETKPEDQPQIKNEVVKKALAAVHGPNKLDSLAFLSDESLDKVLDELAELYDSDQSTEEGRRNRKLAVLLCADIGWAPSERETSVK